MSRFVRALLALSSGALVASCSLGPAARPPLATWDFGAAPIAAAGRVSGTVLVLPVEAPVWLDSPAMLYRLAYVDGAEPRFYASSRWIASPALLLTERLRAALAGAGAAVLTPGDGIRATRTLRVELEQFDQVFDSPSSSRVAVRLRATLVASGTLAAQRTFNLSMPTASSDARGGALALAAAAERGIGDIVAWLAAVP